MSLYKNLTEGEKAAIGQTDTKAFNLVPCPFPGCGSRRLYVGRHGQESYTVECLDCGGRSVEGRSIQEAIENWGTVKSGASDQRQRQSGRSPEVALRR